LSVRATSFNCDQICFFKDQPDQHKKRNQHFDNDFPVFVIRTLTTLKIDCQTSGKTNGSAVHSAVQNGYFRQNERQNGRQCRSFRRSKRLF